MSLNRLKQCLAYLLNVGISRLPLVITVEELEVIYINSHQP